MYNSQYYTCEQIDQRLLQGYLDDYNSQNNTNLTKAEFLALLFNTIDRNSTIDNLVTQIGYYECDTAAGTAAKLVTAANYTLFAGGSMKVKFVNKNTANNVTLNINSQGAKILYYRGEVVSSTNTWEAGEVVEIYYDGTSYYANNVEGGTGDGVFDISKFNLTGGQPTRYSTLSEALGTNGEHIPLQYRSSGMLIKYADNSDPNNIKYVQFRYKLEYENTTAGNNAFKNIINWQGVDAEPVPESKNLAESGGVYGKTNDIVLNLGITIQSDVFVTSENVPYYRVSDGAAVTNNERKRTYFIKVKEGDSFDYTSLYNSHTVYAIAALNSSKELVQAKCVAGTSGYADGTYIVASGVAYIQFCCMPNNSPTIIKLNPEYTENTPTVNSRKPATSGSVKSVEVANGYFVCNTVAENSNKSITIPGYILQNGGSIKIKFEHATTTSSVNLNISNTGLKTLYYNGRPASGYNTWSDNEVVEVYYDGDIYYANTLTNKNKELSANIGYFICSSPAGNPNKGIEETERKFNLIVGGCFKVKFENEVGNTSNVNLVFNSVDEYKKPLYYEGVRASKDNTWEAGEVVEIYYDGENYQAHKISYKDDIDAIDAIDAKIKENTINTLSQTVASVAGTTYSNVINNAGIKAGELIKVQANMGDLVNIPHGSATIMYNSSSIAVLYATQNYIYFFAPYNMDSIRLYSNSSQVTKSNNITFTVTNYGITASDVLKYANDVAAVSVVPSDLDSNLSISIGCGLKKGEPFVVVIEDDDESIGNRSVNIRYTPQGGSLTVIETLTGGNKLSHIHRLDGDSDSINIGVVKGSSSYGSGTLKVKVYKFTADNVIMSLIERADTPESDESDYMVYVEKPYICPSYAGDYDTYLNGSINGIHLKFESITFYNGKGTAIVKTMSNVFSDTSKTAQASGQYVSGCLFIGVGGVYNQILAYDKENEKFVVLTDNRPYDDGKIICLAYAKNGGEWGGIICDQYTNLQQANESVYLKEIRRSYLDTIRDKEMELLGANDYFCFGLCSDVHYPIRNDAGQPVNVTNAVMSELDRYIGFDAIVNGGDNIIRGSLFKRHGLDATRQEFQLIDLDKFIPCVGNHDFNGHGSPYTQKKEWTITDKELETLYFRRCKATYRPDGKLYYYRDFDEKKVRIVVLNTQDVPIQFNNSDELIYDPLIIGGIRQEQINFIVSSLDFSGKQNPNDWKVLFVMHIPLYSDAEGMISNPELINRIAVRNILKAYVNRSTYSYSYTDTDYDGIFTISGNVDFTNANGKLVAVLSGHIHRDQYVNTDGFNAISIQCSYPITESEETAYSLPSMPPMTYSEFAIDVVILDDVQEKIILKRFGCHHSIQNPAGDREYSYDVS